MYEIALRHAACTYLHAKQTRSKVVSIEDVGASGVVARKSARRSLEPQWCGV